MEPELILEPSQSVSAEFLATEGTTFVMLADYAGGTWHVEVKTPDGAWISCDEGTGCQFIDDGLQYFVTSPRLRYRLNGGTPGARAWQVGRGEIG